MTSTAAIPELNMAPAVANWIASRCTHTANVADIEQAAISGTIEDRFLDSQTWRDFQLDARALWKNHDHLILRDVPVARDGASLILLALVLGRQFKSYRGDKVVKHFRMSPWTTALSHTLEEGHFHTDINTVADPPKITAIQCRIPDPDAPNHGEVRVARLADLLHALGQSMALATLAFLQDTDVTMVNESAPGGWTGRIVTDGRIRFHPETLRAAQRRHKNLPNNFEEYLAIIKDAALSISTPIQLGVGDALLVSNTRALHYRGECTVTYNAFPRDFNSREVYVLHLLDEPQL